ncbi:MAG TPA: hypothetical protein VMR99_02755 [Candidatus Paceibacterota bacterium]|nr:hypothetical protein [Candidatus Paceibacterota bacterium]
MQSPDDYILEQLRNLIIPSLERPDLSSQEKLVTFISKTILSKKFRKWSVDADFLVSLDCATRINIERNEPIKFAMPFGGYKLWSLEEAPEVDWAELFTLMYYTEWLKPILDNYPPGAWFDFSSDDIIVERIDNISKAETDSYKKSFDDLIEFMKQYLPKNMQFTFTQVGSRYTHEEFEADLHEKMEVIKKSLGGMPEVSEAEKKMIDLNARPREGEDRSYAWYQNNKLTHDAYMTVSKRRPYYRTEDKLLAFTKRLPNGVAIGTTKTSIAKFWVGVGVLKKKEDDFTESVLSPDQLHGAQYECVPIDIKGLDGKNFKKLRVV